ncbi:hypothetical protein IEZ26_02395 [Nocardioides cavernae]|uniref:Twin-arginine translocation signal domain-containing protein n=1 Tax=Nocardioides cavernae TaxID=1921566 RepID=A0ABR8N5M8_9ACTN|nr:hypothetical protein [Nocardioides cavernae]MBD3923458.1 hypothetical protein [Nocardioides cavernae]MBM7511616.1 hypothetical protein [Nocardioides cavernae]
MSDQLTSQSRSNESGITRRTALRGAAWSASAVTVVVATPNIAAASVTTPPAMTSSGTYRAGKELHIMTTLTRGSTTTFGTVSVTVDKNSISSANAPAGWSAGVISPNRRTATYTYAGPTNPLPATVSFNPVVILGSNDDKTVKATVQFSIGPSQEFTLVK